VAEQIDILPTLLSMLGIESSVPIAGRDLFDPSIPDGPTFVERNRPPRWRQQGVIVGKRSLWVVEEVDPEESKTTHPRTAVDVTNVRPGIYMYDEDVQPGQKLNLYFEDDPKALELLGLLTSHFGEGQDPADRVELDEELKKKLRDLGYIE
jgi:arylsulfatase A-like enzyme